MDVAAAALRLLNDRGRETKETASFGDTGAERGMVRLFMSLGRIDRVGPSDIVRGIAEGSGIAGSVIGLIDIYDRFTFVEVPVDVADKVLASQPHLSIRGKPVNMEPARPREESMGRSRI